MHSLLLSPSNLFFFPKLYFLYFLLHHFWAGLLQGRYAKREFYLMRTVIFENQHIGGGRRQLGVGWLHNAHMHSSSSVLMWLPISDSQFCLDTIVYTPIDAKRSTPRLQAPMFSISLPDNLHDWALAVMGYKDLKKVRNVLQSKGATG